MIFRERASERAKTRHRLFRYIAALSNVDDAFALAAASKASASRARATTPRQKHAEPLLAVASEFLIVEKPGRRIDHDEINLIQETGIPDAIFFIGIVDSYRVFMAFWNA